MVFPESLYHIDTLKSMPRIMYERSMTGTMPTAERNCGPRMRAMMSMYSITPRKTRPQKAVKYSCTEAYKAFESFSRARLKKNGSAAYRNIWMKRFIITASFTAA